MHRVRCNTKFYALHRILTDAITRAALYIQSYQRMRKVRRKYRIIANYEREYDSIKWPFNARSVDVVGNFTTPAWKAKLSLDYCAMRKIFVKYIANLISGKDYEYSLIINGKKIGGRKTFRAADRKRFITEKSKLITELLHENYETPEKIKKEEIVDNAALSEPETVAKTDGKDNERSDTEEIEPAEEYENSHHDESEGECPNPANDEDCNGEVKDGLNEDITTQQTEREVLEKDRLNSGKVDINFDMAFDFVTDEYYS